VTAEELRFGFKGLNYSYVKKKLSFSVVSSIRKENHPDIQKAFESSKEKAPF
jgi:hypothetical protein